MTTRIDFYKVAFSLASRGASLTPDVPRVEEKSVVGPVTWENVAV